MELKAWCTKHSTDLILLCPLPLLLKARGI
jgi:hypothetical protein